MKFESEVAAKREDSGSYEHCSLSDSFDYIEL